MAWIQCTGFYKSVRRINLGVENRISLTGCYCQVRLDEQNSEWRNIMYIGNSASCYISWTRRGKKEGRTTEVCENLSNTKRIKVL
jgi:hypothetical protein